MRCQYRAECPPGTLTSCCALEDGHEGPHKVVEVIEAERDAAIAQRDELRESRMRAMARHIDRNHRLAVAEERLAKLDRLIALDSPGVTLSLSNEFDEDSQKLWQFITRAMRDVLKDEEARDGTDFAHPSYWRGEAAAIASCVRLCREAMEGNYRGVVGDSKMHELLLDIAAMAGRIKRDDEHARKGW